MIQMHPIQILLIEDDPAAARLTAEALQDASVPNQLTTVRDGEEAIAFLRKEGEYAGTPCPDIILIDMNLPRMSGWEVLQEMHSDICLKEIPVVVMTGSTDEDDMARTRQFGVTRYIVKPYELDAYFRCIQSILDEYKGS